MLFGAMGAAIAGAWDLGLPKFIHLPLAILVGVLAGGLYGLLAGLLKAKFGANEYIVTLMLNYVATLLMSYLANGPPAARDRAQRGHRPGAGDRPVHQTGQKPGPDGGPLHRRHPLGAGALLPRPAPSPALRSGRWAGGGWPPRRRGSTSPGTTMLTMFISGGLAAMAGVSMALGVNGRYIEGFSPGYGFNGIAVSSLASGNPLMVGVSALSLAPCAPGPWC